MSLLVAEKVRHLHKHLLPLNLRSVINASPKLSQVVLAVVWQFFTLKLNIGIFKISRKEYTRLLLGTSRVIFFKFDDSNPALCNELFDVLLNAPVALVQFFVVFDSIVTVLQNVLAKALFVTHIVGLLELKVVADDFNFGVAR